MTVEISNKLRRNSRARRNSVVQHIALNEHHGDEHLKIGIANTGTLKKTKSLEELQAFEPQPDTKRLLFPYTKTEKLHLSTKHLEGFQYNILPSVEDQKRASEAKNRKYTQFVAACQYRKHVYEDLNSRSSDIVESLKDLTIQYDTVTKETAEFQSQSNSLINQKTKYETLNTEIKDNLHYYEMLYNFTKKLNNPNPNMVKRESFHKMLKQLDECIEFTQNHSDHKEGETYSRRFRQCMTRSLTLIRNYIINSLKTEKDNVTAKVNDTKIGSVTHDALLYTRFGSDLEILQPLCLELSQRALYDDEYQGLLNDCLNFYFGLRSKLLQSKINEQIRNSKVDKGKSLVELIQRNLSFFTEIYKDEYEVFIKIFSVDNNNHFEQWLLQISEPLYDIIRNHVLYEQSISSLCESATLLDKYYEYENEETLNYEDEKQQNQGNNSFEKGVDLGEVFRPILQDIQSRLVFRAQTYVNDNIVKFKPDSKTFQIGHRKSVKAEPRRSTSNKSPNEDLSNTNSDQLVSEHIYPPIKKGIELLFRIYQLITSEVFDDLAHNIVHDCLVSMNNGREACQQSMEKLDANLYFMKNLLLLQQQIQNFDIEYVSNETFLDFSGIAEAIGKIRQGSTAFTDVGFLQLVTDSVPKVVNNMIDARVEVQTELKNLVHLFTETAVNQIIEPIVNYDMETLDKDVLKFQENIEEALPRLKRDIDLFINDQHVVTMLIDGIQELVAQSYENFYHKVSTNGGNLKNLIEVDSLVSFIGEVVANIFRKDDLSALLSNFKLNQDDSVVDNPESTL